MIGLNYVTNDKGEKTGLLIDLLQLKNIKSTENGLREFLEDLDDIIAVEVSKGDKGRPYDEVRKEILNNK
jgi:hypothetical protein